MRDKRLATNKMVYKPICFTDNKSLELYYTLALVKGFSKESWKVYISVHKDCVHFFQLFDSSSLSCVVLAGAVLLELNGLILLIGGSGWTFYQLDSREQKENLQGFLALFWCGLSVFWQFMELSSL